MSLLLVGGAAGHQQHGQQGRKAEDAAHGAILPYEDWPILPQRVVQVHSRRLATNVPQAWRPVCLHRRVPGRSPRYVPGPVHSACRRTWSSRRRRPAALRCGNPAIAVPDSARWIRPRTHRNHRPCGAVPVRPAPAAQRHQTDQTTAEGAALVVDVRGQRCKQAEHLAAVFAELQIHRAGQRNLVADEPDQLLCRSLPGPGCCVVGGTHVDRWPDGKNDCPV